MFKNLINRIPPKARKPVLIGVVALGILIVIVVINGC